MSESLLQIYSKDKSNILHVCLDYTKTIMRNIRHSVTRRTIKDNSAARDKRFILAWPYIDIDTHWLDIFVQTSLILYQISLLKNLHW